MVFMIVMIWLRSFRRWLQFGDGFSSNCCGGDIVMDLWLIWWRRGDGGRGRGVEVVGIVVVVCVGGWFW